MAENRYKFHSEALPLEQKQKYYYYWLGMQLARVLLTRQQSSDVEFEMDTLLYDFTTKVSPQLIYRAYNKIVESETSFPGLRSTMDDCS